MLKHIEKTTSSPNRYLPGTSLQLLCHWTLVETTKVR